MYLSIKNEQVDFNSKITGTGKRVRKFGQKRWALVVEIGKKEAIYLPQKTESVSWKAGSKRLQGLLLLFQPLYFLC